MNEYLTLPQCAELTGIHIDTLRRNARNGGLIAKRVSPGMTPFRVRPKDLEGFVEKRRTRPQFDVLPGFSGGNIKRGKKVEAVTRSELDDAVTQYLAEGGKIERLNPEIETESTRRVTTSFNLNLRGLQNEIENHLADEPGRG